jgi:murein DD-endopeptidase MepM/ murein hydrolase activator NlpD
MSARVACCLVLALASCSGPMKRDVFRPKYHGGVDYIGDDGAPVIAAADGWVIFVIPPSEWSGKPGCVIVGHRPGETPAPEIAAYRLYTEYCNLGDTAVEPFQRVHRGQLLGYLGDGGIRRRRPPATDGAFVHFQVCLNLCLPRHYEAAGRYGLDPEPLIAGCFDDGNPRVPSDLALTLPLLCH